jgi:hypothetical protein
MVDPTPGAEAPAKRGRLEIRTVVAVVVAVLLGSAVYVAVFGSPNSENRLRDSQDFNPYATEPAADPPRP